MAKKKVTNVTSNTSKAVINQRPINYDGNVKIKVMQGKNVIKSMEIKNSGTMRLFQGIGYFLSGSTINLNDYKPRYISVGSSAVIVATDPSMTSLYNELDISRILVDANNVSLNSYANSVTIPFTAVIPYTTIGSRPISEIGLFSTPKSDSLLARIIIPQNDWITLLAGQSMVIEWDLVIQNSKELS